MGVLNVKFFTWVRANRAMKMPAHKADFQWGRSNAQLVAKTTQVEISKYSGYEEISWA